MNNKKKFVNLYKDIVLVNRVRIFCTTLFYNVQQQHKNRDQKSYLSVLFLRAM